MKLRPIPLATLLAMLALSATVQAGSFVIVDDETVTATQTLNDNETGTIEAGGTLSTGGNTAVNAHGATVTVTNSGSISTTGVNARGIWSTGADATITNSGSISTTGVRANGIYSTGADASIINSGSISTTGTDANGIRSSPTAINASITNRGSIRTTGGRAYGIWSQGINASITNSGSISTTGNFAYGIVSIGDNASITNSGSISTTGDSARGISSTATNASITNSGLISAMGAGAYAIYGGSGNQTLNILNGSRILGAIDLVDDGGDADVANIYGSFGSAVLTFENTETINVFMDNAVLLNGNTVVVVDPTGESITGNTLNALASGAHQVVSQRMQRTPAPKPVQLASLELSPGMLFQEQGPVLWGQVFGYSGERGAQGAVQAYDHDYRGFVVGYELDHAPQDRVGLLAGVASSDSKSRSQVRDTNSVFIGAYGHRSLGKAQLSASLLLGWEDHDNQRQVVDNLNGVETARSSTDSVFLSPSLTLSSAYAIRPDIELRPSVTLSYSAGRYDGYTETGTTQANLQVGSRTVAATSARLQLEGAKQIKGGEVNLRAGMQSRHTNADDVQASLAGSNFQYSAASDDNVSGGFIGVGVNLSLTNQLELVADVETGKLSGNEDYLSGQLSMQYRF